MTTPASSWKFEIEYNSCAADQISVASRASPAPVLLTLLLSSNVGIKPREILSSKGNTHDKFTQPNGWWKLEALFCGWIMMFHQPGNSETKEKSQQTYSLDVTAPGASPQFTQTHRKLGKFYGSSFILHAVATSTHL